MFLKDIGADKVIDRNATFQDLLDEITATTSRPIEYIFDSVSVTQTQQMANDLLVPGGHLQLVQSPAVSFSPDKNVGFTKGLRFLPENQVALQALYSHLFGLLEQGLLKVCLHF
jgi:NADPH:quinone reductase-like Zn-dependent oxidoreductase